MHACTNIEERVRKRKKKMPIWLLLLFVNGSSILSLHLFVLFLYPNDYASFITLVERCQSSITLHTYWDIR
jgi:hypothetical protein